MAVKKKKRITLRDGILESVPHFLLIFHWHFWSSRDLCLSHLRLAVIHTFVRPPWCSLYSDPSFENTSFRSLPPAKYIFISVHCFPTYEVLQIWRVPKSCTWHRVTNFLQKWREIKRSTTDQNLGNVLASDRWKFCGWKILKPKGTR